MGSNPTSTSKPSSAFPARNSLIGVSPTFVSNVFLCSGCSGTSRRVIRATHSSKTSKPHVNAVTNTRTCLSSNVQSLINPQSETSHLPKFDRQTFLRVMAFASLSMLPFPDITLAELQFSTYKGPLSLGFTFSYPASWTVTKKAIKTHLSEVIVASKDDASTTAGLVVDAVKIDSIDSFGTPQIVGQKVVDVEKKKDSVNDASVNSASAVQDDGLTYYVIDYTVDSSRGLKRYIAKVTVTGKQLYVFTAQAKVDNFQGETADVFTKMLESFTVKKQYS